MVRERPGNETVIMERRKNFDKYWQHDRKQSVAVQKQEAVGLGYIFRGDDAAVVLYLIACRYILQHFI
jgi:hypothetical protein